MTVHTSSTDETSAYVYTEMHIEVMSVCSFVEPTVVHVLTIATCIAKWDCWVYFVIKLVPIPRMSK